MHRGKKIASRVSPERLTRDELRILSGIADGESTSSLAQRLFMSESTLKQRRKIIFTKLSTKNAPHAVYKAFRLGLID